MKSQGPSLHPVTVHDQALAARCAQGRVIIIDDDPEILQALAALMESAAYACETYTSGLTYLQVVNYNRPSFPGPVCLLCDVKMPGLSGLELCQKLTAHDDPPLLIMSGSSGIDEAIAAFRGGVLDFFTKPVDADTLLAGIQKALALSTQRQQQRQRQQSLATKVASMTPRERNIARQVARGLTNPVIAQKLGIALRTVKLHRQRAMEKLGVGSLADLVRLADEGGL